MIFKWLKNKNARKRAARALYQTALGQSRAAVFYGGQGASDTMDGRFDLLVFHVALLMHGLKPHGAQAQKLSQALFDVLFVEVEFALRESGVGDLGVPKHMAKMMKAFNGRIHAYMLALDANDMAALELAIARNILRRDDVTGFSAALAAYGLKAGAQLQACMFDDFMEGRISFPHFVSQSQMEQRYAQAV